MSKHDRQRFSEGGARGLTARRFGTERSRFRDSDFFRTSTTKIAYLSLALSRVDTLGGDAKNIHERKWPSSASETRDRGDQANRLNAVDSEIRARGLGGVPPIRERCSCAAHATSANFAARV